ncbi:Spindle assembly abnormal protein 6 [Intoshia linei]|uniref:Spindle assembly abnormal protein 6 n=1 Tax=Intoshia linei TaxID=1819745 RepID=A0A177B3M8_9BILA|nr:Spindle assembly abnormal protein 6 [Intoshia linei]
MRKLFKKVLKVKFVNLIENTSNTHDALVVVTLNSNNEIKDTKVLNQFNRRQIFNIISRPHANFDDVESEKNINISCNILTVQITDPDDPSFFYRTFIDEAKFTELKRQQGILVNFDKFSEKLISFFDQINFENERNSKIVLQITISNPTQWSNSKNTFHDNLTGGLVSNSADFECNGEKSGRMSQMSDVLSKSTDGMEIYKNKVSTHLSILEIDDFKNVVRLSLQLEVASPDQLIDYLISCLRENRESFNCLKNKMESNEIRYNEQLRHTREALGQRNLDFENLKQEMTKENCKNFQKYSQNLKDVNEKHVNLIAKLNDDLKYFEEEKYSLKNEYDSLLIQQKANDTQSSNTIINLTDDLKKIKMNYQNLNTKLDDTERRFAGCKNQLDSTRKSLNSMCQDKEDSANCLKVLQKKNDEYIQINERLNKQLDDDKITINSMKESCNKSKEDNNKANEIIRKMANELKNMRTKSKLRNEVTHKQECIIVSLEEEKKVVEKNEKELKEKLQSKEKQIIQTNRKCEKLTNKTKEFEIKIDNQEKIIKSHENHIAWLNKEINKQSQDEAKVCQKTETNSHIPPSISKFMNEQKPEPNTMSYNIDDVVPIEKKFSLLPRYGRLDQNFRLS